MKRSAWPSHRRRCGFTLAEVLCVVIIVASLASVLLPAVGSVKKASKGTICVSNLHQIYLATLGYQLDHDDRYPYGVNGIEKETAVSFGIPKGDNPKNYPTIVSSVIPYLSTADVEKCPLDTGRSFLDGLSAPVLYEHNGGSSFFCADLVTGQTSEFWPEPSRLAYCVDGDDRWHTSYSAAEFEAFSYQDQEKNRRVDALFYDGHVRLSKSAFPCWALELCEFSD